MIEVSCLHVYHVFIAPLLHRMSCLVNCNVVLKSFLGAPRVVYPWKIVVAEQPGLSVRQFYKTIEPDIQTSSTVSQLALDDAYLGKSKTELASITLDMVVYNHWTTGLDWTGLDWTGLDLYENQEFRK